MDKNSVFTRNVLENMLPYRKFCPRELRYISGGTAIVAKNITNYCQAYVTTMEVINLDNKTPELYNYLFGDQHILEFDPISLQNAAEIEPYQKSSREILRLEQFFDSPLGDTAEIIVVG